MPMHLLAAADCVLIGLRGVGAAACHADAEQQCKDAAECSNIEMAQGHSRRSPDCQVCLTICCTRTVTYLTTDMLDNLLRKTTCCAKDSPLLVTCSTFQ